MYRRTCIRKEKKNRQSETIEKHIYTYPPVYLRMNELVLTLLTTTSTLGILPVTCTKSPFPNLLTTHRSSAF